MTTENIYKGPELLEETLEIPISKRGYTARDQAKGFGIPETHLRNIKKINTGLYREVLKANLEAEAGEIIGTK